ncbi:MAG: hypothetical protein LUE64_06190 [Candidatus Gastranaerophilales bacterium]|nr:hypothetical protein [Candidatus Gastranaerophilales bacterium]
MKINNIQGEAFQSFHIKRQNYEEKLKTQNPTKKPSQNKKTLMAVALIGATVPVIAYNLARGRGQNLKDSFQKSGAKEKIKAIGGILEIDNFTSILASNAGAVTAGVAAGVLTDKNPGNRQAKYKEGIFEFLNSIIPTCIAAAGETASRKNPKLQTAPARAALIAGSVAGGMFIANKTSNKINEECFDDKAKRKFKPADCLVHLDDILGLFVIAKVPFVQKLNADKILPLLYARAGFEAGEAENKQKASV